ncbi:hypothetical protein LCGC14_0793510 [marine sediment metagenome]|uniref:DUF4124 domain-containing protein n=1 Tax=marine sediment metagenome TaxID=412755 RepID=A0A0F9QBP9_9ZZZZ
MMTCFMISALSLFYVWTTDDGVLSFTDTLERVPVKYRGQVSEREWKDVRARWTQVEKK